MANLDTRNKRASAIGFDLPFGGVYPNPDSSVTQPDRQQVAHKYSGILAGGAAAFKASWARSCNVLLLKDI